MLEPIKRAYHQWRSRCPFVRRIEAWRMRGKVGEFKVRKKG